LLLTPASRIAAARAPAAGEGASVSTVRIGGLVLPDHLAVAVDARCVRREDEQRRPSRDQATLRTGSRIGGCAQHERHGRTS
jgi:microcystin degradation protein MlrC